MRATGFLWVAADMMDDPERRLESLFILSSYFGDQLGFANLGISPEDHESLADHTLSLVKSYALGIISRPKEAVYARRLTDWLVQSVSRDRVADAAIVAGRFEISGPGTSDSMDFDSWIFGDIEFLTDFAVKMMDEGWGDPKELPERALVMLDVAVEIAQEFENETSEGIAKLYQADAMQRREEKFGSLVAAGKILERAGRLMRGKKVAHSVTQRYNQLQRILGTGP